MLMVMMVGMMTISWRSDGGGSCCIRGSRRRRGTSTGRSRSRTDQLPPRRQRCHISKVLTKVQFHYGIVPVHAKNVGQYGV